jgi:hypothetical protein
MAEDRPHEDQVVHAWASATSTTDGREHLAKTIARIQKTGDNVVQGHART